MLLLLYSAQSVAGSHLQKFQSTRRLIDLLVGLRAKLEAKAYDLIWLSWFDVGTFGLRGKPRNTRLTSRETTHSPATFSPHAGDFTGYFSRIRFSCLSVHSYNNRLYTQYNKYLLLISKIFILMLRLGCTGIVQALIGYG